MGLAHSPKVVTNGLVFAYDASTASKSLKGKPTTNYCYLQNPRVDSSYTPYVATTSGTWPAKHFDAITVYNQAGTDISAYQNTGVGDWTNTYHAIWTYDEVLQKPVVTMRDLDGQWKAKSFGIVSMSSMGLTHGSTYSISWLQWTSDTSKCVWAGIYQRRSSDGAYNFYDGLSGDQGTAYNTIPYKWQRVYATFTVTAGMDLSVGLGLYMYGMYGPYGTLKISDVQLEAGVASGFHNGETRSSTQAIVDPVSRNTITVSNLTYASNGNISYNGSSDYLTVTNSSSLQVGSIFSINAWVRPTSLAARGGIFSTRTANEAGSWQLEVGPANGTNRIAVTGVGTWIWESGDNAITNNTWVNICYVRGSVASEAGTLYVNGNVVTPVTTTSYTILNNSSNKAIASGTSLGQFFTGSIDSVLLYNRMLTAAEVTQNFNARRGLYGI